MDPDSSPPSRPARSTRSTRFGAPGVRVVVSDGRGRPVADGGLGRWLTRVAPRTARGELAIALVSDARMRVLNRSYRRKDYPTDVLSFAAEPASRLRPGDGRGRGGSRFLGDLVIAAGVAKRQAREAGHSYQTELRVLALHGLLHLLGYDHEDPADNGRMTRTEARLRRKGGLTSGLIGRHERLGRGSASIDT
ncbi:MAG TPA: rRNA maturation RNase YbeY [Vicinamibacterales bacterium]|nr:rRNA maturation RNase YbeY [Vicinamibacterales bacterium]